MPTQSVSGHALRDRLHLVRSEALDCGGFDRTLASESVGLTSHKSSCNCTGCGMLRAGVCINCAEKIAAQILAQILESGRRARL